MFCCSLLLLTAGQVDTHSYLDFITMLYTSLNSLQFFFILLTANDIYELMGLTETIEQSSDQQLCIHMCPMEQRKRENLHKRPLCLFLSFFFLYMWLPSIRWCIYIYRQRISSHVHIQPYFVSL